MSDTDDAARRPRPQYGEYATPEEQRAAIADPDPAFEADAAPQPPYPAQPPYGPSAYGQQPPYGAAPQPPQQAPGQSPYLPPFGPPQGRPDPQQGGYPPPQHPYGYSYPQAYPPGQPYPAPRRLPGSGDRVATFVLLGFGLWNVISMVSNAVSGGSEAAQGATALGEEGSWVADLPAWVWTGSAAVYVVVWLIAAVLSMSAIRHRRWAFWIPLVAGVLATVVSLAIMIIAVGQNPGLIPSSGGTGV